jgi:hypothetical protein
MWVLNGWLCGSSATLIALFAAVGLRDGRLGTGTADWVGTHRRCVALTLSRVVRNASPEP